MSTKSIGAAVAAALVAAALVAPSTAAAARPRAVSLDDCHEHSAFYPIQRSQAREWLPVGFEPVAAPAENENLTNLFVSSFVCGDPADPRLEWVTTHLVVDAPPEFAATSNHYVLDAGLEGPAAAAFRKTLCTGDAFGEASITVSQESARSPLGAEAGVATTSVSSDFISTEFVVSAERTGGWGSGYTRWFFGDGTSFFDSASDVALWGIGSSAVAFTEAYRGLPQVAAGGSKQSVSDITFSPAQGCRRGR